MQFKVGDRARIRKDIPELHTIHSFLINAVRGTEVVLIRRAPEVSTRKYKNYWEVLRGSTDRFYADESVLEPLIDPKAEQFVESLKKLGREPVLPKPETLPSLREVLEFYQARQDAERNP